MKKLIAMILAAAMLLSLTACGSTAADAAADNPEAETASADASAETPPEKPDGTPPDGANGQPGTPPDGNPPDGAPNGQPGGFGGSGEVTQGTSANTISEDTAVTGTSYSSTGDDENALSVDGAAVTLDGITVDKRAGATSNTEDGDFYGMNAALLATNGATVTIKTRLSIPPRRTATAYSAMEQTRPSTSPIPPSRRPPITPAASRPPAAARRTRKT